MGILLLISHFGWEGYRWQVVLIYVIIVCLVSNQFFGVPIGNKMGRWTLFIFGILGILISSGLSYLIPVFSIPEISGPYHVVATHESVKNELGYKIWFPTEQGIDITERDTYHPNPTDDLNGVMGMPGFVFSHLKLVKTNASPAPEPIDNTVNQPLVIYSHGASSTHVDNTSLLEEIASNGFVVVAINHDFSFDKYGIDVREAKKIEIDAQKALIDKLIERTVPNQITHYNLTIKELERKYPSQIDFTKIALVGHSLGGATASSGALEIEGVKAVVNMDGPIDKRIISDYSLPFLYLSSFSPDLPDDQLQALGVPPEFYRGVKKYELESVEALFQNNSNEKFWIRFKQANHLDFTDIPFMIPFMSAPHYDRQKGHELKSEVIVSFLNRALKGETEKLDYSDKTTEWIIKATNNDG
ncbi:MAG: hypothetical protein AAF632_11075 [Bacteroidota bacterium]